RARPAQTCLQCPSPRATARLIPWSCLMKPLILGAVCVIALAACSNPEAERQQQEAAAAQERAKREADAEGIGKLYDTAVTAADWEKARIHGAALLDQYPDSETAKRI